MPEFTPITFADCLSAAVRDPEFVEAYDRLRGTNLSLRGSAIDLAIDSASGRLDGELRQFILDVKDLVWDRLPPEVRAT